MTKRFLCAALLSAVLGAAAIQNPSPAQKTPPPTVPTKPPVLVGAFMAAHCLDCHNADTKQGNLDLTTLPFDTDNPKTFAMWVKVHDRVQNGEMPPPSMEKLTEQARKPFLTGLATPLIAADDMRTRRDGRAAWRRMNRYEYENTLRDLFGTPWLQIKEMLPEDGQVARFNKVGTALDVSHVQMSRYLAAADYALRESMAKEVVRPETTTKRYYAREQGSFTRPAKFTFFNGSPERATFPIVGNTADSAVLDEKAPMTVGDKDPTRREQESIGVVASAYEPIEPKFDKFRAPAAGRYKVRLCAHSFWAGPESAERWWRPSQKSVSKGRTREPVTLYSETPPRQLRKLGTFEVGTEPTVNEIDVNLLKGETVRPDAVRLFRSRPPGFRNPLAQSDGQPGVAFQWLEVVGPINDEWPGAGHKLMFGDLPFQADAATGRVEVIPNNPEADAQRLLAGFMKRAYRRPVQTEDIAPFVKLVQTARDSGMDFTDALITAYSAVLCSPDFVTLEEKPGILSDQMLASRLAYFLWNGEPDASLRTLAGRGELHKPAILRAQTERMLADPRSHRFVDAFLDYWLDLRKVNDNSPDEFLYPDYYLDDYLVESSRDETRAFFGELITKNLPARNIVDSNFVMVNERLANLYALPGVKGVQIRRVLLPPGSVRGGLLTQASVLKVTANGTTTSPVLRGVWINERILGQISPPPPAAVAAVEPDIRGAATIREQLAKHRTQPTCNACHSKIDPAGFALENFDVVGGWRDKYRSLGAGEKVVGRGKNGTAFAFCLAQPVDPTGVLPDGRAFQNVRELKKLLVQNERQIARNLVRQFVTYGTGAPPRFGDRPKIEAILDRAQPTGYGVKSLLYATINSELFRSK